MILTLFLILVVVSLVEYGWKNFVNPNYQSVAQKVPPSYLTPNQHCYITGGSSGLGLALAKELSRLGANVTIVARTHEKLAEAIIEISSAASTPESQRFAIITADVTDEFESESAFEKACESELGPVDWVFTCAGAAIPGYFHQQQGVDFENGIKLNYLGSLYTIKAAVKQWLTTYSPPTETWNSSPRRYSSDAKKIVLISSTLGLVGMIGYSQYAPTKFAINGLAQTLRQELSTTCIKTHVYFVSTIKTPGFQKEEKTKPDITKALEGSSDEDQEAISPVSRARTLINGICRENRFMITSDWGTYLLMLAGAGGAPLHYIGEFWIGVPFAIIVATLWRLACDWRIKNIK